MPKHCFTLLYFTEFVILRSWVIRHHSISWHAHTLKKQLFIVSDSVFYVLIMALNIIRQVTCNQSLAPTTIAFRKASNLYHPDYLKPPPDPRKIHKALCLHLEGFDYAVLEKYQIFAVKATKLMGLNVAQCYPLPHKEYEVERYKSQTQVIQATYNLKIYQRVIQVDDVPASKLCGWIRVLEASLPSGIKFQIDHHTKEFEDKRYIPNLPLLELKSTLQEITGESPVK